MDNNYGSYADGFAALAVVAFITILVMLIVLLVVYVLFSYALMVMAQKKGIENPWLAWIPIAQFYILGKIIDNVDISTYNINKLELVLPIAFLATSVLGNFTFIGPILSLACWIFIIFVFAKLYKMYAPSNVVLYTILSAVGLFVIPMLIIKNNDSVEIASTGKPVFK